MATIKKAATSKATAQDKLYTKLIKQLGSTREEIELRALTELAERLEEEKPAAAKPEPEPAEKPRTGGLPKRLYLLLDGRGLDGRGLPVEVIDLPATIGSSKRCSVWVNSPNIETKHLQISQDGNDWVLEDLNSAGGTFLDGKRIARRTIRHGEEYSLAGYLRMRTELR
jgi:hypothetical protein